MMQKHTLINHDAIDKILERMQTSVKQAAESGGPTDEMRQELQRDLQRMKQILHGVPIKRGRLKK
jgi:flagellin-like hook-associated protein FlgL